MKKKSRNYPQKLIGTKMMFSALEPPYLPVFSTPLPLKMATPPDKTLIINSFTKKISTHFGPLIVKFKHYWKNMKKMVKILKYLKNFYKDFLPMTKMKDFLFIKFFNILGLIKNNEKPYYPLNSLYFF
jgi:hypothetical protein